MTLPSVSNQNVVLAGTFSLGGHAAIKEKLTALGARVTGSISSKTNLVFVGKNGGTKLAKAREMNIDLFEEAQLAAVLQGSSNSTKPPQTSPNQPPKGSDDTPGETPGDTPGDAPNGEPPSFFADKIIVLTGTFVTMKRKEAQKILAQAGANIGSGINKKTQLLIYGDKAGSKLAKARKLGVEVMTEAEMVKHLQQGPGNTSALGEDAAEKIAQAQAQEQKRMRPAQQLIEKVQQSQLEKYGATIPSLLLSYLEIFAKRPDVHVYTNNLGRPTPNNTLLKLRDYIPQDLLAFCADIGKLEYNWVFTDGREKRHQYSEGYNGGRLDLVGLERFRWYPKPDWQEDEDFVADALFDNFVAEGNTRVSYDKGEKPTEAALVFDNANDCERYYLGSIETYITDGAKAGFTWYWQMGPGEFTDKLYHASLPRDTPAETIIKLLQDQGLRSQTANAMVRWLGESAVILLHQSYTPDGVAAQRLALKFPMANVSSERTMDTSLIEQLASNGEPLTAADLQARLENHAQFLSSGGSGGRWQMLSVSGLPLCIYRGAKGTQGEQIVFRLLNISSCDLQGANLSYADISGAYCNQTNFSRANLKGSVLIDALFANANFQEADLTNTDFSGSNLAGANFQGANLTGADFEATDLTGANFKGAILTDSRFPGAKLEGVLF